MTSMEELITYAAAFVASLILGGIKSVVGHVDPKVTQFVKPFQPIFIGALAVILPLVASAVGLVQVPTVDAVAAAPLGTILAVTAREILRRWKTAAEE